MAANNGMGVVELSEAKKNSREAVDTRWKSSSGRLRARQQISMREQKGKISRRVALDKQEQDATHQKVFN